ncbi:zinc finger protein ZAT12-like [Pyrus ussuriensis x Pyrus communis]|uniref:Zinc finger protein ZAT12-like n=1 Tax=Pyrus ussuriensis x Pyrus communis TaxID=2448454 RepID=A0A5N5HJG0_9ROSA|nr:zinc finger protein ZAT12-like [Pyrus ussuriensis x Pyrus communis]
MCRTSRVVELSCGIVMIKSYHNDKDGPHSGIVMRLALAGGTVIKFQRDASDEYATAASDSRGMRQKFQRDASGEFATAASLGMTVRVPRFHWW